MSQAETVGSVLIALLTLSSFLIAAMKIIIGPINELTNSVNKLNFTLDEIMKDQLEIATSLKDHEKRINNVERALDRDGIRVRKIESIE